MGNVRVVHPASMTQRLLTGQFRQEHPREGQAHLITEKEPHSVKKIFVFSTLLVLLILALASCTVAGNDNSTGTTGNTVGLTGNAFSPGSITIKKGTSITLVNQANVVHIISNGSWQNGTADPQTEPGAPVVNNYTISSPNQTEVIGPFNTAGTFHYLCIVHTDMNLTVVVQ